MSADPSCVFCRIVAGSLPCHRLYEDAGTLAFLDINPANPGHALVISRDHRPNLYAAPPETLAQVLATVQRVATAVEAELQPDGLNLVQANGAGAAQSVPHFHVHVLPRQNGDALALNWGLKPGDPAALAALAERLRRRIEQQD